MFCCNGCVSVYDILLQSDLGTYYQIENQPGSIPGKMEDYEWKFLDNDDIVQGLLSFSEGDIQVVQLFIPSIHCSSCIWLLENLAGLHSGIKNVQVNFLKKTANITFSEDEISLKELAILVNRIGYKPHFGSNPTNKDKSSRNLLIRLGVAGFCFGNVMLLSFPEYMSHNNDVEQFRQFFSYLILALSIPVILYCGSSYLRSAWTAISVKQLNLDVPIAIGMLTLYSKSLLDIFQGVGPGYMDSFVGFVFLLLVGKWFKQKTFDALSFDRNYQSYFPLAVSKMETGLEVVIPLRDLEVGDHIKIRNNEVIPADGLLESSSCQINYSFVTGESQHIAKQKGELVYAGGRIIGYSANIEIKSEVDQSYLTSIWNNGAFQKNKNQKGSRTLTRLFLVGLLAVSVISAFVWLLIDVHHVPNVITSVLIVACPCAIALAAPFTFGTAMRIFGGKQLYLKNADVVASLGDTTDVVFDKTGTLTIQNKVEVRWEGKKLSKDELAALNRITSHSAHPISRAIEEWCPSENTNAILREYTEILGKGVQGKVDGILYKLGNTSFVGSSEGGKEQVFFSKKSEVLGWFEVNFQYRPELKDIISNLSTDFRMHILSGDNNREEERLRTFFGNACEMRFEQMPLDKLEYIKTLQNEGNKVLMIGDGLNDSGALAQSDVGLVVSDSVFNFSPACDGILDGESFRLIPRFISFASKANTVLYMAYGISILYNLVGLYFACTNQLTPLVAAILMPLSSISIILFTTLIVRGWASAKFRR